MAFSIAKQMVKDIPMAKFMQGNGKRNYSGNGYCNIIIAYNGGDAIATGDASINGIVI